MSSTGCDIQRGKWRSYCDGAVIGDSTGFEPVERETRARHDRAKFPHWIDADRDCRDTRDEVLAAESLVRRAGPSRRSPGPLRISGTR